MSTVPLGEGRGSGTALRWSAAALVVAGLHAGTLWWLAGRAFPAPAPPEGTAGVTIDLEPIAVPVPPAADPKPMENAGPAPEPRVAEAPDAPAEPPAASAPEPPQEIAAPTPPAPAEPPAVEAAALPPPPPVPEVVPPAAPAPSDAVLAPPPPPPRPAPPKPAKTVAAPKPPPPRPDPRQAAREQAREAREEARRQERAEAAAAAREERRADREQARAARAAAVRGGGGADRDSAAPRASGADVANWRGELAAHLRAYKPDVQVASGGTARVTITVDRSGRVTSASLAGSSGDGALDQAAVAMMHRASPVPAPPPEAGRQTITVPVRFY